MEIKCFNRQNLPIESERHAIAGFLFRHLEQYGDPIADIEQCISYALSENGKAGGFVLTGVQNDQIVGAVIINKTGMNGYIPENILVYIATHHDLRGKGIGKSLLQKALQAAEGDVALHVEPDNPAKRLYEYMGFTNKYLEMRLKK